ncbi:galactokinase family protein [Actinomycetaceae bacterium L2_0104]
MKLTTLEEELSSGVLDSFLVPIYGAAPADLAVARERLGEVARHYRHRFDGESEGEEVSLFTAPGRTEMGGNHTDHQRGRVLAGAVSMDMVACAGPNGSRWIRIASQGYPEVAVNLDDLERKSREEGTSASLVRGVAHALTERGYELQGFSACVSSTVPGGAGLSSSAAYEILIGVMLNHLSCGGAVSPVELAQFGQYAESQYFGKPCGLLDQMACSIGGVIGIDFADPAEPAVEEVDFNMDESGHVLCIVESGGNHADLTAEYASIPDEMREVAAFFDKQVLREVDEAIFWASLAALREQVGDRAVLRAIHFFEDNARVPAQVEALRQRRFDDYFAMVAQSGQSSGVQLQNLYATKTPQAQDVVVALSLAKHLLGGRGAVRVHGGGFAGTIQAYVPVDSVKEFSAGMEAVLGEGSCHTVRVRPIGGAVIIA